MGWFWNRKKKQPVEPIYRTTRTVGPQPAKQRNAQLAPMRGSDDGGVIMNAAVLSMMLNSADSPAQPESPFGGGGETGGAGAGGDYSSPADASPCDTSSSYDSGSSSYDSGSSSCDSGSSSDSGSSGSSDF